MSDTNNSRLRTRIVDHGEEDPAQLLAHPQNFRRHPGNQLDALRGSMKELGWLKGVIVNRTTGHVIDGHARVEESMRQGLTTIPVDYVELSEEEEKLALAVLDPISEMARRDNEVLSALLSEVHTEDPGLQALLDELSGDTDGAAGEDGGEASGGDEKNFNVAYTIIFESLAEQEVWFRFLAEIKDLWPEMETISGRLVKFLEAHPVREG